MAQNETIIIDYKGKIVSVIPIKAECIANWGEGFLLAEENSIYVHFFRFEDQKYVKKFSYGELADKENKICGIDTNE